MAFPLLALLPALEKILDKVIPDSAAAERAKAELIATATNQEFQLALAQIQTNQEEAKHSSIFVAGWRPFIGWVCGAALAWHFIGYDLIAWFVAWRKVDMVLPNLASENLMELTLAMLGMAGLRSWEKSKNIAR